MWQNYIHQLINAKSRINDQSQFQACKIAIPFTWGISTNQRYTMEYWNFCNQILPWSQNNEYFPAIGSFVNSYEAWLNLLTQHTNLGTSYISQVRDAQQQLDNHAKYLTVQYRAYRKTLTKKKSVPLAFSDWVKSMDQGDLVKMKDNIDALVHRSSFASSGSMSDYARVWAAFNKSSNFRFYVDSGFKVYNKRIFDWTEDPISIQAYSRRKKQKAPISIGLCGNLNILKSASRIPSTNEKTIRANPDLPFIRTMQGNGIIPDNKRINLTSYIFSGELKFEDTLIIEIAPNSNWFIESFLLKYKGGPYNNPNVVGFGSQASPKQSYFFDGENAILPSYITSLIIGFNPSFKLFGDNQFLSLLNKSIKETGGIYLGPISFKNEKGIKQIDLSDLSNNVITSSNVENNTPLIIGVNLRFFVEGF